MLENTFIAVLSMSITASVAAVLIIFFRWIFGNRLPKIFNYALWAIVLVRLLIPFFLPSMFSIFNAIPVPETIMNQSQQYPGAGNNIQYGRNYGSIPQTVSNVLNNKNNSFPAATPEASVDPMQVLMFVISRIWLVGVIGLFSFSIFAYFRASLRLKEAVLYNHKDLIFQCSQKLKLNRKVQVYTSDRVHTPVVCGLIKARIILPLDLTKDCSELELKHIITHELVHIKRFDYILKPLSVWSLCIHWFNPVVWIGFILSQKDMEMSCDEKVVSVFDNDIRSEYAASLIKLAAKQNVLLNGGLLAFGESNIKSRIKGIMNFRKPALWVSLAAVAGIVVIGVVLLTNGQYMGVGKNGSIHQGDNSESQSVATGDNSPFLPSAIDNQLWIKDGWTYYLEQIPRGGAIPLNNYVGRLCRQNSEGAIETLDELVIYRNGSSIIFPAAGRIVFIGFAGTNVMDFKTTTIVSIKEDGSDRKTYSPKFNAARQLCCDNGYLYYEGWTNDGAFPRPVCRIDADLNNDIKMSDIDGSLITVYDGYAYYLNGSIYRLKLDWTSKPELWDKAAIGKNITSVQKTADNEYTVVYDEKSKPYILRLLDEKRKAFNVVQKYFVAFENADYKSMRALATDRHNKNLIHDGDVWGMKWARAKEIALVENPSFLGTTSGESTLVYGVSVDMETVKTSAQYPSVQTFFYIVLIKGEDGIWRVDRYTTG